MNISLSMEYSGVFNPNAKSIDIHWRWVTLFSFALLTLPGACEYHLHGDATVETSILPDDLPRDPVDIHPCSTPYG